MRPWVLVDAAPIPGGETLRLMRRDADVSIRLGSVELMTSREHGSEEALAVEACARLRDPARARVLIGGLGLGFTLRAALAALPAGAGIVVAELVPAVVSWARGPLADLFGTSLRDSRVEIVERDVGHVIGAAPGAWDAIVRARASGRRGGRHTIWIGCRT